MPLYDLTARAIVLRSGDDVAVVTRPVAEGDVLCHEGAEFRVPAAIGAGHKVALRDLPEEAPVRKYGQVIGFATRPIARGDHVHTHNLGVRPLHLDYDFCTEAQPLPPLPEAERRTFLGYRRDDGRVATRNYLAVVSTVNCSASVSRYVAERFRGDALKAYPNVDGVVALTHKLGCGMNIAGPETRLLREGGASILAETTGTYGAEHLLTRRAVSREVGEKLLALMRWWERYTAMHGAEIDNNPAPGNKAGGLTTIYEKSLGAVAKGGTAPLVEVYEYAEPVTKRGFVFMDTPGHDPVSITGLVAGGANVILFTTGRGSVFGCKPAPSIKVSTTTRLFRQMNDDMDFDAGVVLNGVSVADVGRALFEKTLAVASGERTKSEIHGMGDEEFNPWMIGPTL